MKAKVRGKPPLLLPDLHPVPEFSSGTVPDLDPCRQCSCRWLFVGWTGVVPRRCRNNAGLCADCRAVCLLFRLVGPRTPPPPDDRHSFVPDAGLNGFQQFTTTQLVETRYVSFMIDARPCAWWSQWLVSLQTRPPY